MWIFGVMIIWLACGDNRRATYPDGAPVKVSDLPTKVDCNWCDRRDIPSTRLAAEEEVE